MTREEFLSIRQYLGDNGLAEMTANDTRVLDLGDGVRISVCRFRDQDRGLCHIYPVRPLVCRLMGCVEWMPCPEQRVKRLVPTPLALAALDEYCRFKRQSFSAWLREHL